MLRAAALNAARGTRPPIIGSRNPRDDSDPFGSPHRTVPLVVTGTARPVTGKVDRHVDGRTDAGEIVIGLARAPGYRGVVTTQVIVLNGGSSSGKSGIARCLQAVLPDPWLAFGVDTLIRAMPVSPRRSVTGIDFASDGAVILGPQFRALEAAWIEGVAAMAHAGYRHELHPVITIGADLMDRVLGCLISPAGGQPVNRHVMLPTPADAQPIVLQQASATPTGRWRARSTGGLRRPAARTAHAARRPRSRPSAGP